MADKSIPLSFAAMTKEQLDAELRKYDDYNKTGRVYSADEVAALFVKKFGIFDMRYNKLTNLIPIINPDLSGESGIRAAILYRIYPSTEIDSCETVRKLYRHYYGNDIPESADTIFNAFTPFLDFCRSREMELGMYKKGRSKNDELALILLNLKYIFYGYGDLKALFDRFFDLMYSFSNLMPVPKYFNGSAYKNGKGTWGLNNDYPSLYYKNLEDEDSKIYKSKEMKQWLDEVMNKYKIMEMYELDPPYPISEYYGHDDKKLNNLVSYIEKAIKLIENRFKQGFPIDTV